MKTWHEIVTEIQTKPEFSNLVRDAYFSSNLSQNYNLYSKSTEAIATLKKIRSLGIKSGAHIIDIGCGNGISSLFLAQNGYHVTCIEPDESSLVGTGAINQLANILNEKKITTINCYAEKIPVGDETQDLAFARQSLHHAGNLNDYCKEVTRTLKKGCYFLTVRDHVIFNQEDKEWFLETHPLHKFYGGENAYTLGEYISAFESAGLEVIEVISHFDSVINYYPLRERTFLKKKIATLFDRTLILNSFQRISRKVFNYQILDETKVPGRCYTFISRKK